MMTAMGPLLQVALLVLLDGVQANLNCGDATNATDPTRPNVLLLGDSISMVFLGYGENASTLFKKLDVAVQHNGGWSYGGQAANTVKGLHCTDPSTPGNWLNHSGPDFDVIHFNFGLHDLGLSTLWGSNPSRSLPETALRIFATLLTRCSPNPCISHRSGARRLADVRCEPAYDLR
jgi:hypothetical protein